MHGQTCFHPASVPRPHARDRPILAAPVTGTGTVPVPARSGKNAYLSVRASCSDFLAANRIKCSKSPTVARRPNANCFQQKLFQQISSETLNV